MKNILSHHQMNVQMKCFGIFCLIVSPVILFIIQFKESDHAAFWIFLLASGWFVWTFVEYCLHRFWNHSKNVDKDNHVVQMHLHHHTHPTEIKITGRQRLMMIVICMVLILSAILISKWIMLAAGAWTGVSWFFLIHYFLHQKWAVKIFPRRVNSHMIHHCKEPETCYGVSFGWWDEVFGTLPQKNKQIAERVIAFYYRKEN